MSLNIAAFRPLDGSSPTPRQPLKLLLVASRHHLSSGDIRSLIQFLESEDCGFDVTLQVADPNTQPELLELRWFEAQPQVAHDLILLPARHPAPKLLEDAAARKNLLR